MPQQIPKTANVVQSQWWNGKEEKGEPTIMKYLVSILRAREG